VCCCCCLLLLPAAAAAAAAAGQHLEEVKFLNGTITRLKEKLAAAEKEAAVAHTLKVSVSVFGGGGLTDYLSHVLQRHHTVMQAGDVSIAKTWGARAGSGNRKQHPSIPSVHSPAVLRHV
jgi:hypothetical protein